MSTPSLLNIPYLYKAGTLYSQIPESGAGDFTVSRTTTVANRSTRINKNGFIETVLDNVPRLDYPLGGAVNGCPALLVEPSAQNTCLQSAGFELSGTWAPTNISVTTGTTSAFTAPDGSTNADLLADNSTNGRHRVQQNLLSFTSGTTYTFSVFVKKNSSNRFLLINANTAFNSVAALSLDTLAITNISGSGASVENYGNGWYRFSIRGTASATTAGGTVFVQMQDTNADGTYIGDGSSFYLWGAQLETGSVATSYIPTTTAAVTRSAEIISDTTASALIGQTEGTLYADISDANTIDNPLITVDDGTNNNRIVLFRQVSTENWSIFTASAGAGGITSSSVSNNFGKFAIAYSSSGYSVYRDGVEILTRVAALPLSLNTIRLNGRATLDQFSTKRILAFALHPNRLSNAQLATLTAP